MTSLSAQDTGRNPARKTTRPTRTPAQAAIHGLVPHAARTVFCPHADSSDTATGMAVAALAAVLDDGDRLSDFSPQAASAALAAGRRVVLLWQPPAAALTGAIDAGQQATDALADWSATARDMLALFRRNRRRVALAPLDILAEPDGPARLATHLGLDRPPAPVMADDSAGNLLARLAIQTAPDVTALEAELRAGSPEMPPPPDTHGILTAAIGSLRLLEARAADAQERTDDALARDADARVQLATATQACAAAQKEIVALRGALAETMEELRTLRGQASTREEVTLLRGQLALVQGMLENIRTAQTVADQSRVDAEMAALRAELDEVRRDRDARVAHEAAIYASNSWRVTAPLRRISLIMGRHRS